MKTNSMRRIGLHLLLTSSVCGATYGVTGCLSAAATSFNPCGTVLNCDPAEWDTLRMGSLPNYDYNPTCVVPGLGVNCGGTGGGTDNTNTNTNNNSNSNTNNNSTNNNASQTTNNGGLFGFGT
jgi:hypothetical protein